MVQAYTRRSCGRGLVLPHKFGPMHSPEDDVLTRVQDFVRNQCLQPCICECRSIGNFRFRFGRVISMNAQGVLVEGQVVDDSGRHMHQVFNSMNLIECACPPTAKTVDVRVVVSNPQWHMVISKFDECLLLGAKVKDGKLFLNHDECAVIPVRPEGDIPQDAQVSVGEIFSGGFSGWSHSIRALIRLGMNIGHEWSIDKDPMTCNAFAKTHQPTVHAQSASEAFAKISEKRVGHFLPSVLFQSAVQSLWWITFASVFMSEVITMSAPCPSWSVADASPGLNRCDGFLIVLSIFYVAIMRPRVWISENVSSLKTHRHWKLVAMVIEWLNYQIHWNAALDLREIIPHARDRVILICHDIWDHDILRVKPVRWPMSRKHTLRSYGVICDLDAEWLERSKLTADELRAYLDPMNLPREFCRGHAKRSNREVQAYRLRDLDSVAACILTTYGKPMSLSDTLIRRGGICGSLLMIGPVIRKLVAPELAILLGLIDRQWIPEQEFQSTKIFGNAISVPHALIGVLNAIAMIRETWTLRGIPEIFADVMSEALNATNLRVKHEDGGFVICKAERENDSIPPTIPTFEFAKLRIRSPMHSFVVFVEVGVNISQLIAMITAESVPNTLEIEIDGVNGLRFPLPASLCMSTHDTNVWANVPSCLLLTEQTIKACDWPFVVALHPKGMLVVLRRSDFLGVDLACAVSQFAGEWNAHGTDFIGRRLEDQTVCPNVAFLCNLGVQIDFHELLRTQPVFKNMAEAHLSSMKVRDVHAFIHWLERTGIHSAVRALGWHFLVQLNVDPDEEEKDVILAPKVGRLAVTPQAIAQIIITRIVINQIGLISERLRGTKVIKVAIKLWETWVWTGNVDEETTSMFILDAWKFAHEFFEDAIPIRLIAFGQQLNPEWPIKHYDQTDANGDRILKLHIILQLRGGGPAPDLPSQRQVYDDAFCFNDLQQMERSDPSRLVSVLLQNLLDMHDVSSHMDLGYLRNAAFRCDGVGLVLTGVIPTVVRFLRDLNLTGIEKILQALGWHAVMHLEDCSCDPVVVKLMIIPRAGIRHLGFDLVKSFLAHAIATKAMPCPRVSTDGIRVRVKMCDSWIVDGIYHTKMLVADFIKSWSTITTIFGEPSQMRAVCQNRSANPDWQIGDYALDDDHGQKNVKMFLVLQLRGGGSADTASQATIKQKNELAKHLLEIGCSLEDVSTFVDKAISVAGMPAIANCMKNRDTLTRTSNLEKLAKTLKLTLPPSKSIETAIRKQTQKKITTMAIKQEPVSAAQFQIQSGFFFNQDGSEARQCDNIKHGSSGIALVDPQDAAPWIRQSTAITQDELALLVLGSCPLPGSSCLRLDVPATSDQDCPVLLSCCCHQLGRKDIVFNKPPDVAVNIEDSSVVAVTVFRDEVENTTWDAILQSPVRAVFDMMKASATPIDTKSPPWGRTWRDQSGKCSPSAALSLQFHVRVTAATVPDLLKASGQKGVYLSVKTEDKRTDPRFSVLWLDLPLAELRVAAASHKKSLGLVKISRGTSAKISRGIRFMSEDLTEAAKEFKPSSNASVPVQVKFTARLAPTPVGATFETVKELIEHKKWPARPIKSLGANTWLIGFSVKVDESWISWNGKLMLLTWDAEKKQNHVKPVLAGKFMGSNSKMVAKSVEDDPRATWLKKHPNAQGQTSSSIAKTHVARSCEGPIEERFAAQDSRIDELKNTVADMSKKLETAELGRIEFKKEVENQFMEVQGQVKNQVETLTQHFDQTLERAMRRQDSQLESSFSELKALIMNKPLPAKKARVEKPTKKGESQEDGDEGL